MRRSRPLRRCEGRGAFQFRPPTDQGHSLPRSAAVLPSAPLRLCPCPSLGACEIPSPHSGIVTFCTRFITKILELIVPPPAHFEDHPELQSPARCSPDSRGSGGVVWRCATLEAALDPTLPLCAQVHRAL